VAIIALIGSIALALGCLCLLPLTAVDHGRPILIGRCSGSGFEFGFGRVVIFVGKRELVAPHIFPRIQLDSVAFAGRGVLGDLESLPYVWPFSVSPFARG